MMVEDWVAMDGRPVCDTCGRRVERVGERGREGWIGVWFGGRSWWVCSRRCFEAWVARRLDQGKRKRRR